MSEAETQCSKMTNEAVPGSSQSWSDSETDVMLAQKERKKEPYVLDHMTICVHVTVTLWGNFEAYIHHLLPIWW